MGSRGILNDKPKFFEKYKKCISFDRKGYSSVITKMKGDVCCSDKFANSLVSQLNKYIGGYEKDPTGRHCDSHVFVGTIPECTNISVGYFNEHTEYETQNITFLEKLCNAVIKVDWENLKIG